jgi:hypothetical protein
MNILRGRVFRRYALYGSRHGRGNEDEETHGRQSSFYIHMASTLES